MPWVYMTLALDNSKTIRIITAYNENIFYCHAEMLTKIFSVYTPISFPFLTRNTFLSWNLFSFKLQKPI